MPLKSEATRWKWLGVMVRQPPSSFLKVEEALRLAVAAASKDVRTDVVFCGPGAGVLRPSVPMDKGEAFDLENMLEMLRQLGGSVLGELESIPEAERGALRSEAQLVPSADLLRRLTERDFNLVF